MHHGFSFFPSLVMCRCRQRVVLLSFWILSVCAIKSVSLLLVGMNEDSTFYLPVSMPKPDCVVESCSRNENTETIGFEGSVGNETTSKVKYRADAEYTSKGSI